MPALARAFLYIALLMSVPSLNAASAAVVTTQCGTLVSKTVLTSNSAVSAPSYNFTTIPGAAVNITIPTGATRCITVRFSAEATTNDAYGFVRALASGVPLNPGNNSLALLSQSSPLTARETHQFIWSRRLGAGTHKVNMQWALYTGGATFTIHTWTMEVEIEN